MGVGWCVTTILGEVPSFLTFGLEPAELLMLPNFPSFLPSFANAASFFFG